MLLKAIFIIPSEPPREVKLTLFVFRFIEIHLDTRCIGLFACNFSLNSSLIIKTFCNFQCYKSFESGGDFMR